MPVCTQLSKIQILYSAYIFISTPDYFQEGGVFLVSWVRGAYKTGTHLQTGESRRGKPWLRVLGLWCAPGPTKIKASGGWLLCGSVRVSVSPSASKASRQSVASRRCIDDGPSERAAVGGGDHGPRRAAAPATHPVLHRRHPEALGGGHGGGQSAAIPHAAAPPAPAVAARTPHPQQSAPGGGRAAVARALVGRRTAATAPGGRPRHDQEKCTLPSQSRYIFWLQNWVFIILHCFVLNRTMNITCYHIFSSDQKLHFKIMKFSIANWYFRFILLFIYRANITFSIFN